jgi:hypothetical protein
MFAFWAAVTGSTLPPSRGRSGEFVTVIPSHGDPHLRVQRIDEGPGGSHLDLHVDDVGARPAREAHAEPGLEDGQGVGDVLFMALAVLGHEGASTDQLRHGQFDVEIGLDPTLRAGPLDQLHHAMRRGPMTDS